MKRRLSLIVIAVILVGVLGVLGFFIDLRNYINPPIENTMSQGTEEKGCLSCHEGIEVINEKMQPFLLSFAQQQYGKGVGYECAICHEGNPSGSTKVEAHKGLISNPSSMWVLHQGKGCAKCHDSKGSITTLMGKPLPKPVG